MKLSIGQAWDESKAIFRADGGAILAVTLALTVLPGAILETISPSSLRTGESTWWLSLLGLISALLSLVGQLAVSRIALGPSITVGGAIGLAFRRVPALFGALFLLFLPFVIVLSTVLYSQGVNLDGVPATLPASVTLPLLVVLLGAVFVLIRMLFLTPLAADRDLNAIALIKQAWRLSSGRMLKLFLLIVLLMFVAALLLGALGGALSAVVILALGPLAPGNVSALLVALIQQGLAAFVSVLFVVVVCRLYLQATGDGEESVTVPHAGGD